MLALLLCVPLLPAQSRVTAFTGATVWDGSGKPPVPDVTMIVRDGRIATIGPADRTSIPAGATRVTLNGGFVIPGLINTHGHVNSPADLTTYARYGVTTVVSLGGEGEEVFVARASQNIGTLNRARVFVAGPVLAPTSPAEARTQVDALAARRVDFVKIRVDDNLGTAEKMSPEVFRAVIDEAHTRHLRVAAHLYYLADAVALLRAGVDFIAHSVRDTTVDRPFLDLLKASGRCYTPTLMREVSTWVYESTPDFFSDSLFEAYANRDWVASLRDPGRQASVRTSRAAQAYKAQFPVASANLQRVFSAGIPVAMGTDTGPMGRFQGYFELMELELMVKAGLTPAQALASATSVAAHCLGREAELGTLEPGRWADFVVLNGNPLTDISTVRRIESVWIAGNPVAR